jgi:hypothetical protein
MLQAEDSLGGLDLLDFVTLSFEASFNIAKTQHDSGSGSGN